jgi:hypothetical protein
MIGGKITVEVKNMKELKSLVDDTIKIVFGGKARNIVLISANLVTGDPDFEDGWLVTTECQYENKIHNIKMHIRAADGIVLSSEVAERRDSVK